MGIATGLAKFLIGDDYAEGLPGAQADKFAKNRAGEALTLEQAKVQGRNEVAQIQATGAENVADTQGFFGVEQAKVGANALTDVQKLKNQGDVTKAEAVYNNLPPDKKKSFHKTQAEFSVVKDIVVLMARSGTPVPLTNGTAHNLILEKARGIESQTGIKVDIDKIWKEVDEAATKHFGDVYDKGRVKKGGGGGKASDPKDFEAISMQAKVLAGYPESENEEGETVFGEPSIKQRARYIAAITKFYPDMADIIFEREMEALQQASPEALKKEIAKKKKSPGGSTTKRKPTQTFDTEGTARFTHKPKKAEINFLTENLPDPFDDEL